MLGTSLDNEIDVSVAEIADVWAAVSELSAVSVLTGVATLELESPLEASVLAGVAELGS